MIADIVNGLFEFCGALMLARNVLQLHRDKMVRGVHWMPTSFFAGWGIWNLYYYPNLDQWWSFSGGLAIVSVNLVWLCQMWCYRERPLKYVGDLPPGVEVLSMQAFEDCVVLATTEGPYVIRNNKLEKVDAGQ